VNLVMNCQVQNASGLSNEGLSVSQEETAKNVFSTWCVTPVTVTKSTSVALVLCKLTVCC
jgi:hypothetical protein